MPRTDNPLTRHVAQELVMRLKVLGWETTLVPVNTAVGDVAGAYEVQIYGKKANAVYPAVLL